jgi:formylglycine-generating enzyme required for sulfatase activity
MPEFTEPSTGMEFVFVPGGHYQMGDLYGDGLETELPVHTVHLDNFYMGKYPVTQAQWERLMKDNPSRFKKDDRPVEQVNWYDIQEFIKRLSRFHGGKYRFFLPSEAQWEFAARSGGKEEKYAGSDIPEPVAWYDDNSDGHTRPVGEKLPNGLGLFDMSGNVWEWCRDAYVNDAYHFHPKNNPLVGEEGPDRVIRGGSWNMNAWCARCFRRFGFRSEDAGPGVGCRLVMIP